MNTFLGTSAIIASCLSSGFASTYFERLLRIDSSLSPHDSARPSLWIRNVQLSLWGLLATLPLALRQLYLAVSSSSSFGLGEAGEEGSRILEIMGNEFFKGFNRITWLVILLQVIGGLLGGKSGISLFLCSDSK
jgi:UDP-sugar transporter A1/2/3